MRAAGAENRLALDASVPGGLEEWNVKGGVPENDDEEWQNVVVVNRNTDSGKVNLNANWRSNDNPDYSVPPLGSSHQGKGARLSAPSAILQTLSILPASFLRQSAWIRFSGTGHSSCIYSLCRAVPAASQYRPSHSLP